MQQEILEKHPQANLKVYTVWFSMLAGDSRSRWRSGAMPDPRVTHFWDEERIASQWFAEHVEGAQGLTWDIYFLYGPEATWDANGTPQPLISSGATVLGKREELQTSLLPLLKEDTP